MSTEPCAECGGTGDTADHHHDCEWCDGTGEVAAEDLLPPPAPPKTFTVSITTNDYDRDFTNIVSFEPAENVYLMVNKYGHRFIIPYGKVYQITVIPDT